MAIDRARLTTLHESFKPKIEEGTKRGLTEGQTRREAERFLHWAKAKKVKYADWDAAWRMWLMKACEMLGVEPKSSFEGSFFEVAIGTPKIVFLRREDPRFEEWLRFKNRKSFPLNRDGGWYFPSEHPPSTPMAGRPGEIQRAGNGAEESDEPFL